MWDRWSPADDFARQDAEQIVTQQHGCSKCPDFAACKAEGACIRELELDAENEPKLKDKERE